MKNNVTYRISKNTSSLGVTNISYVDEVKPHKKGRNTQTHINTHSIYILCVFMCVCVFLPFLWGFTSSTYDILVTPSELVFLEILYVTLFFNET